MQSGGRGLVVGLASGADLGPCGQCIVGRPLLTPLCLKGMWKGTGWWGGWHQSPALVGGTGAHEGTPAVRTQQPCSVLVVSMASASQPGCAKTQLCEAHASRGLFPGLQSLLFTPPEGPLPAGQDPGVCA